MKKLSKREMEIVRSALNIAIREEWVLYNDNIESMPNDPGIKGAKKWALKYEKVLKKIQEMES